MGLISRIRGWFTSVVGRADDDTAAGEDEQVDESPTLDPSNVTEVRTEGSDDSVSKLQDVRSQQAESDPESSESGESNSA